VFNTKGYKTICKTSKCKLALGACDSETGAKPEERTVRLFHDDTFPSFYRRLSFSPDGELLVVPSGVLEMEGDAKVTHCAYVFSRTNFNK
jgi:chromatin assembly factor 1 subunit B